ncbi:hypothetical protein JG687_00011613, partial [Phytophthora cactorum]
TQKPPSIPSTGLQNYRPNRSNLTKAERYQCAIDAVDAGISVREAAKRFEVAREYLRLRFLGLRPLDCRRGPQLLYINEDADVGLLEAIEFRAARGMCIGTSQFRELVPRSSTGNVSEACSGQLSWQEEDPERSSGDHLHVWSRYARNFSTASQLIEE